MSLLPSATSGNAEYGSGNGEGTENGQPELEPFLIIGLDP